MVTITKKKTAAGNNPALSNAASSDHSATNTGGVTITKRPVAASKPAAPVSNSTAATAKKTGSTYVPRSTSQWREVSGGRVSTTPVATGVNRRVNAKSSRVEQKGHTIQKRPPLFSFPQSNNSENGMAHGAGRDGQIDTYQAGFSPAKLALGTVMKGTDKAIGSLTDAADLFIGKNIANVGVLLGQDWSNNPVSALNKRVQQAEKTNQAYFQPNIEVGGNLAAAVDKYGTGVAAAVPQALFAIATAGGTTTQEGLATAANIAPGVMASIKTGTQAMFKDPQYWLSFFTVVGDNVEQAKADGASDTEAALYGMVNGLFNAAVEVGGGIQTLPKELQAGRSAAREWVKSMCEEGSEEVAQGVLERGLQNLIYNQGNQGFSTTDDRAIFNPVTAGDEFMGGAIVGGVLGGGELLANSAANYAQHHSMPAPAAQERPANAPVSQNPATGEITPGENKPPMAPSNAVPEFTPEDFANIEADLGRDFGDDIESGNFVPVNDNPASLVPVANTLGKNGKKTMIAFYDGDVDTDLYAKDFVSAYNAGLHGVSRPMENYITKGKAAAAYFAGQNDAKVYGKDAGLVRDEYTDTLDGSVMDELDQVSKMLGVKVQFANRVNGGKANAQIQDGIISIEKNNPNPVRFLFGHEITHRMQELSPKSYEAFRDAAMEIVGGTDAIQAHIANYAVSGVNLTESQAMDELSADYAGQLIEDRDLMKTFIAQNQQNRTLLQKIGDAIRAIAKKLTGKHKALADNAVSLLEKAVRDSTRQAGKLTAKNAAGNGDARYSLNENFAAQFDAWVSRRDGSKGANSFFVGTTSDALKSIGVSDYKIYWRKAKVSKIMQEHPGMTAEIIKSVPDILEHPILVMQSRTMANRITLFGEAIDLDGKPVLAALELSPQNKTGEVQDFAVIVSAYGKNGAQQLIDNSEILYVEPDKKRTDNWLGLLRLQLPSRLTNFGSIHSITTVRRDVNGNISFGSDSKKTAMQAAFEKAATEDHETKFSMKGADDYITLVEKYGAIKPGEKPTRDVQIPRKTADNKKVSQTVRTAMEAGATPDATLPTIEEMVAKGDFSYEVYSDKRAISDAAACITDKGYAAALMDWTKDVQAGKVSKENTATGWALYNAAANAGDMKTALNVLTDMVGHQRNAAQAVQATRILKQMPADAQLYTAQRSVSNLQEELKERYKDKAPNLKIDKELAEQFKNAKDQAERDAVMREIYRNIGKQMPSRFIDKWNAWRYLAMLGNPRTHVRNVLGNAFFAPMVGTKDVVAAGIEAGVSKVTGGKINRSKGFVGIGKNDRVLLVAAAKDYAAVQEQALGSGKYSDLQNANKYIEEGRQIFKSRLFETARKANGAALDAEDIWFSQPHYAAALAQYCKANGITAEQLAAGTETKFEKARTYAILEAQKATYRDTNSLSDLFSRRFRERGGRKGGVKMANTVMEGILPFRKTPANILARGIEYSPIGLMNGIKKAVLGIQEGNSTAAEAIDSISAGLTGTGLLALGTYLAAQGLLRGAGGGDDKEKDFEDLQGHQTYSMELPDGTSVTLDWLAPEVLPVFVGVNLYEQTAQQNEDVTMASILSAVSNVTEPLLEMSCLQSLNDVFDAVGYASSNDMNSLSSALASASTSYVTQAFPTVFGQIERTAENQRMTTYTEKNAFLTPDMQYTLGKISGKTPGEYRQIPYIDAWGRTESTGSAGTRAFNNFLNPAYISTMSSSDMERELQRLYDTTGEGGVFPSRAEKKITVDGVDKYLKAEEYVTYATEKGQKSYSLLSDLIASTAYQRLSEEEKVKAVKDAYDLASKTAKAAVSDYETDAWMQKAAEAEKEYHISSDTYLTLRSQTAGIESLKDKDGKTIPNSKSLLIMQSVYNTHGLSDKQRQAMFEYLGVGKTVRNWNKALVKEKLAAMRNQAK